MIVKDVFSLRKQGRLEPYEDYQAQYDSPLGEITMTSDGESLQELRFSDVPFVGITTNLHELHPIPLSITIFDETCRWLDCYFRGENPDFTPPIAPSGTPFQRHVWNELLSIPFGQTVTYGDIARNIGCKSAQAIGGAVGSNPIAIIIPCHRVVGSDGSLTGYAYGLERKRKLLMIEQLGEL